MIIEKEKSGILYIISALISLLMATIPWIGIVIAIINIWQIHKNKEQARWPLIFDLALTMSYASGIICFLRALSVLLIS